MENRSNNNNNTFKECLEFPPFPVCSGNGLCDTTRGICICNEGWSSIGEFASTDGVDCNININALKIMHLLIAVLSAILVILTSNHIGRQIHYYRMKEGKMKGYLSDPSRVNTIWILMMGVFGIAFGAYRYSFTFGSQESKIISIILAFGFIVGYFFSVVEFINIVVRFFYHYTLLMPDAASLRMKREVDIVLRSSHLFRFLAVVICLIPSLYFAFPDHEFEVASAFYLSLGIWHTLAGILLSIRGVHIMIKILEEHAKNVDISMGSVDNKMQMLLYRLRRTRFIFSTLIIGPIIGWFLVACLKSFTRQGVYFDIYLMTCCLLVSITKITAIPPQKPKKTKVISPTKAILDAENPNGIPNVNLSAPQSSFGGETTPQKYSNVVAPPVI